MEKDKIEDDKLDFLISRSYHNFHEGKLSLPKTKMVGKSKMPETQGLQNDTMVPKPLKKIRSSSKLPEQTREQFAFLGAKILGSIEEMVERFENQTGPIGPGMQLLRHNTEKELFKFVLIGLYELMNEEKACLSQSELRIVYNQNYQTFSRNLASSVEKQLYESLCKKESRDSNYFQKRCIILRENLKDQGNSCLRRAIIAQVKTGKHIALCPEEDLFSPTKLALLAKNNALTVKEALKGAPVASVEREETLYIFNTPAVVLPPIIKQAQMPSQQDLLLDLQDMCLRWKLRLINDLRGTSCLKQLKINFKKNFNF